MAWDPKAERRAGTHRGSAEEVAQDFRARSGLAVDLHQWIACGISDGRCRATGAKRAVRARGRAHEPARCSSRSNRRTWNMRRVAAQHAGCHHPYAPLGRSNVAHHLRARARWRVSGSPELAIDVFRGMGAKRGAGPPQNARRWAWRARLRSAHEVPPCFAGAVQSTGRPHDFVETVWA